ncbi:MAG: hypothetical protein DHS20C05_21410 [Hyphococcus sp.]|nr:MAG: hypothetical protein DHS20C05_21410 [Marinicaulis sp.]
MERDVPLLRKALKFEHGGWIANALGDVGSPAAIEALVEDLPLAGFSSQTGWALFHIGPEVLAYLLPALEPPSWEEVYNSSGDEMYSKYVGWRGATYLIAEFRSQATIIADDWINVATDRRAAPIKRIAALRGLGAMKGYLGEKSQLIRPIRQDSDQTISRQAFDTLILTHDISIAEEYAASCQPTGDKWDSYVFKSRNCLQQLSEFGANGHVAGEHIRRFLHSENKMEQLYAIEALGLIGYAEAIPQIESFLASPDWRHVYASIRALGHLRSRRSVGKIEEAVRNHWLWELQRFGERASTIMVNRQPFTEKFTNNIYVALAGRFGNYNSLIDFSQECESGIWLYRGGEITFTKPIYAPETILEFPDGKIIATDNGEFGGSLEWHPKQGDTVTLVADNTSYIFPVSNGYLTIHGISHIVTDYGFAVLVTRNEYGAWHAKEVARFPGNSRIVQRLEGDLFAANFYGRVITFSPDGIQEPALCDYSP